jgi:hypothetical protein
MQKEYFGLIQTGCFRIIQKEYSKIIFKKLWRNSNLEGIFQSYLTRIIFQNN